MKPTVGHFAKVKHDGNIITVLIEQLTFNNNKLYEIRCRGLNDVWHKGFYPNEILEVIENPDAEKYLAQEAEDQKRRARYQQVRKITIVSMDYDDGYLNNFE